MQKKQTAPRGGLLGRIWKKRALYCMLAIPMALLVIFKYLPIYGVQIAFRDYLPGRSITESPWVGWKYFVKFFSGVKFWPVLRNTLAIGLYSVAVFPCAVILALGLNYLPSKGFRKTVQMISYLPHFITTVVMCSIILQFFDAKNGMFNALTAVFGIAPKNYMGDAGAFYHIYIWTSVWQDVGYASIIYVAALAGVSTELHEAAIIDGAITSACENPEVAMRWLDYWFSEEGMVMIDYGFEGVNWEWNDTPAIDGTTPSRSFLTSRNEMQNVHWQVNTVPYYRTEKSLFGRTPTDHVPYLYAGAKVYEDYETKTGFLQFAWCDDLDILAENNELRTVINDYVLQTQVQFITGAEDIDDDAVWAGYLDSLAGLQLDRYLETVKLINFGA